MDPNAQDPQPNNGIDLSKILLPKKEGPSTASAERVNAGVLLQQEQSAGAEGPAGSPSSSNAIRRSPLGPSAPADAPKESSIKQLETYQGDIESVVEEKNISVVSIAAAEAERRGKQLKAQPQSANPLRAILFTTLGVLLVIAAVGVLSWIYLRSESVPVAQQAQAPFIAVDATQVVTLEPSDTPQEVMQALVAGKNAVHLSLGLIAQLLPAEASTTGQGSLLSAQDFLSALAPDVPSELLRTLNTQYLLGVHSYDENDAFLILQTDDYDTAYAGMLAWEPTLKQDLSPLFTRNPSPALQPSTPSTTFATSTATTTATSTATTSLSSLAPAPLEQNFSDEVVDNHDARVLLDSQGNIILLWTFLDQQTLVITNNDATLREIISRLSTPAVEALPQ